MVNQQQKLVETIFKGILITKGNPILFLYPTLKYPKYLEVDQMNFILSEARDGSENTSTSPFCHRLYCTPYQPHCGSYGLCTLHHLCSFVTYGDSAYQYSSSCTEAYSTAHALAEHLIIKRTFQDQEDNRRN